MGAESMQGFLDEVALFKGALTEDEVKELAGGTAANQLVRIVDAEGDGLPDAYEIAVGLDPTIDDAGLDPDEDNLTNLQEFEADTNPFEADTDQDDINDDVEIANGTNPLSSDTDGDGLSDKAETGTGTFVSADDTGTDPTDADTDGDLWPDGLEVKFGGDAHDPEVVPLKQGEQNLIAYWDFNSNSNNSQAVDSVYGHVGEFRGRAADDDQGIPATSPEYTASGDGVSGSNGDRAVYFGGTSELQHIAVEDGSFMSLAAPYDQATVTFWQRLDSPASTFSFYGYSPSVNSGGRGISAHVPWSNEIVYFDSAGCCTGGAQRLERNINDLLTLYPDDFTEGFVDYTVWTHYAFVKNGTRKEIYVNGFLLNSSNGANRLPADFERFFIGSGPGGVNSLQGTIDDLAVFATALFPLEIQKLVDGAKPDSLDRGRDADNDGMADIFEELIGLDPTRDDSQEDPDEDNVVNVDELNNGTNPFNKDTDNDGRDDNTETGTGVFVNADNAGTDPLNPDTDGDGLLDGVETNTGTFVSNSDTGTNPLDADSDDDTFVDGLEVVAGSNASDKADVPLERGQVNLLAYWDFNDDSDSTRSLDKVRGLEATLIAPDDLNMPFYTNTGDGHTGANDDRGMDLEFGQGQGLRIDDGEILNLASVNDQITVSMWQKLYVVDQNNTFFWGVAPSAGNRGISVQTPWSNGNIYFDTAGCCDGGRQRIFVNILDSVDDPDNFFLDDWHHFVVVKNGATKQIWLDGELLLEGTNTAPLPSDFTTAYVGVEPSGVNGIQGVVDDLAIYAAALTPEEIAMVYNGTSPDALPAREVIANPEITALQLDGGNISIEYTGTLQSAPSINGPWTDVTGGSPHSEAIAAGAKFFRVVP